MREKDRKRILLVANGFYPEISPRSFRTTELAKEFCRQGHEVVVLTKYREHDYSDFLNAHHINLKMWGKPRFPRPPVFKSGPLSFISRVITRTVLVLFEYPAIEEMFQVRKILKEESNYDLMISVAVPYPIHWGTAWARRIKHPISTTWVADCGDPYMGDVLDSFRKPFYFSYLEKWFCRKAKFITIPIEGAIPAYYPEFHSKIRIIPQGFDFDLDAARKEHPGNQVPEFAYAGVFLQGIRDPSQLLHFLTQTDLPFKFHVFTNQPGILEEYRQKLNGNLIVSSYIPREELMLKMSGMDFLVNFDNNSSVNVPSKLIDYAIINRPVLNIDKDFSMEKLQAFLSGDYRSGLKLPPPEQYHIKKITGQFLNLL